MIRVCGVAFPFLCSFAVLGANVSLAWNPSPSANAAGYKLHYGAASGRYTSSLDAGTNTTMTVKGLIPGQTYYFVTDAYNFYGVESRYSNVVTSTVPLLPVVLAQPIAQTAAIGTIVALSVDVVSATPVRFQWFLDGNVISGATSSMLILPGIMEANAGIYKVVASNAGGSVTSQTTVITVLDLAAAPSVHAQAVPAGVYNGLFYQTNAAGVAVMTEGTTGFLSNCTIGTNGACSSRLMVGGGVPFTCSGIFNASGEITTVAYSSQPGISNLSLSLHADAALGTGQMTGVVSNMDRANPWVALLTASVCTNAFSPAVDFLFLSPRPLGQLGENRICQLTIASNGAVLLFGQLGDGAPICQTGFVGANGSFPLYQSLYNNTGMLAGWITFAAGAPIGNLTWIQPAGLTQGFTNVISFGAGPGSSTNRFEFVP